MIKNPLQSIRTFKRFSENLSKILQTNHAIKIKPIKLCHCIAKAIYGEQSSWNTVTKKLETPRTTDVELKPTGLNRAIVGASGIGKSCLVAGEVLAKLYRPRHNKKIKVIIDTGRSYEALSHLSDAIVFNDITDAKAPIPRLEGSVTIYEMESMKFDERHEFLARLQTYLSSLPVSGFDLILDETYQMSPSFLAWALSKFEGDVTVIAVDFNEVNTIDMNLYNQKIVHLGYM